MNNVDSFSNFPAMTFPENLLNVEDSYSISRDISM